MAVFIFQLGTSDFPRRVALPLLARRFVPPWGVWGYIPPHNAFPTPKARDPFWPVGIAGWRLKSAVAQQGGRQGLGLGPNGLISECLTLCPGLSKSPARPDGREVEGAGAGRAFPSGLFSEVAQEGRCLGEKCE